MKLFASLLLLGIALPVACGVHAQGRPESRWLRRSRQAGLTPLQKKACEQLARLPLQRNGYESSPVQKLQRMGLGILPILAEALDDTTSTQSMRTEFSGPRRPAGGTNYLKVNEIAAGLVLRVAEHHFVLRESPKERMVHEVTLHPELAPAFRKLIGDWYTHNQDKTLVQRKIADVRDPWFRNRMDAAEWIGSHKVVSGRPALERYVATLLARKTINTLTDAELSGAALALGQVGDKAALPMVRRVYNRFIG